ncbi:MAG: hypothetical protein MJZ21_03375 [archaeon]|nr:hypothetical protein [archaeon]
MNLATLVTLVAVLLLVGGAAYRVYRMIRNNDMCYACPNSGCCSCNNPINCTIKQD